MSEVKAEATKNENADYKVGFEEGFHKGIVQGYIKGHTDANEEKIESKSVITQVVEYISKLLKDVMYINTPISSLLQAVKSFFKSLPALLELPKEIKKEEELVQVPVKA
jgi:methyltransferase-like protein